MNACNRLQIFFKNLSQRRWFLLIKEFLNRLHKILQKWPLY
jgi:hypothetical protein